MLPVHPFQVWRTSDTREPAAFKGEVRAAHHLEAERLVYAKARRADCTFCSVNLAFVREEAGPPAVVIWQEA